MSARPDYSALDAAIVAAVKDGAHRKKIIDHDAQVWSVVRGYGDVTDFRARLIVDRRLSVLKKAGKLMFVSKTGWAVTS